jgi:6-phosphogluconolactonase
MSARVTPAVDAASHLASAPGALGPAVLVCPDAPAIAARALDLLVDGLRMAIRDRGLGQVALTGGSSASALYRLLREDPRAGRVDWSRVHAWLGDERFVPFDDQDSNWGTALREWLDQPPGAAVPASNRHPIPVDEALAAGRDNHWAAARYAAEMATALPLREGLPSFDVWLLGLGTDGHILSAFPHGPALAVGQPLALGVAAPTHLEPHVARVTLAPHLLAAARSIIVMVPGVSKAAIVGECFGPRREPARLPAQMALRPNATWLLDAACAAAIQRPV